MKEGKGKIYSWTEMKRGGVPSDFKFCAPYFSLLVELTQRAPKITTMMTDVDVNIREGRLIPPEIDEEVELVIRKMKDGDERGLIQYGYKARKPIPPATQEQIQEIEKTIRKAMREIFD